MMTAYTYRAYDRDGSLTRGEIDARTEDAALDALHRRGLFPLDVTPAKPGDSLRWWEREITLGSGTSRKGLVLFTRELATLLKASVPIDKALGFTSQQPLMPRRMQAAARALESALRGGRALSSAMENEGALFPEFYWRLVEAGEASGALPEVLTGLAAFLEQSEAARSKTISALLYPAVLVLVAIAAAAVIVTQLIPTVLPLFSESGATPPAILAALAALADFLARAWLPLVIGGALAFVAARLLLKSAALRNGLDRAILKTPLLGRLIATRETGRFCRTLSLLLNNGVKLDDAVRIAAGTLANRPFRAAAQEAGTALAEGERLSRPLARSGLFSDLALGLISVGEETGELSTMLSRVADIYETALAEGVNRAVSLLSPVLTLLIGGLVGGLIISVMGAIMSVNDLVLQ